MAFSLSSTNPDGAFYDSRESGTYAPMLIVTTGAPPTGDKVLLNAGDISACSTTGAAQTAQIIAREPGTVMAGGD